MAEWTEHKMRKGAGHEPHFGAGTMLADGIRRNGQDTECRKGQDTKCGKGQDTIKGLLISVMCIPIKNEVLSQCFI